MPVLEFKVAMTCDGCATAAKKVLSKLGDQVTDVQIDVATQKVTLTTDMPAEEVKKQLEKTGKEVTIL